MHAVPCRRNYLSADHDLSGNVRIPILLTTIAIQQKSAIELAIRNATAVSTSEKRVEGRERSRRPCHPTTDNEMVGPWPSNVGGLCSVGWDGMRCDATCWTPRKITRGIASSTLPSGTMTQVISPECFVIQALACSIRHLLLSVLDSSTFISRPRISAS